MCVCITCVCVLTYIGGGTKGRHRVVQFVAQYLRQGTWRSIRKRALYIPQKSHIHSSKFSCKFCTRVWYSPQKRVVHWTTGLSSHSIAETPRQVFRRNLCPKHPCTLHESFVAISSLLRTSRDPVICDVTHVTWLLDLWHDSRRSQVKKSRAVSHVTNEWVTSRTQKTWFRRNLLPKDPSTRHKGDLLNWLSERAKHIEPNSLSCSLRAPTVLVYWPQKNDIHSAKESCMFRERALHCTFHKRAISAGMYIAQSPRFMAQLLMVRRANTDINQYISTHWYGAQRASSKATRRFLTK